MGGGAETSGATAVGRVAFATKWLGGGRGWRSGRHSCFVPCVADAFVGRREGHRRARRRGRASGLWVLARADTSRRERGRGPRPPWSRFAVPLIAALGVLLGNWSTVMPPGAHAAPTAVEKYEEEAVVRKRLNELESEEAGEVGEDAEAEGGAEYYGQSALPKPKRSGWRVKIFTPSARSSKEKSRMSENERTAAATAANGKGNGDVTPTVRNTASTKERANGAATSRTRTARPAKEYGASPDPAEERAAASSSPTASDEQPSAGGSIHEPIHPEEVVGRQTPHLGVRIRAITAPLISAFWYVTSSHDWEAFVWQAMLVLALLALLRLGVNRALRWLYSRFQSVDPAGAHVPFEDSVFECMLRPLEIICFTLVGTYMAEALSRPLAATGIMKYVHPLRELGIIVAATMFILRWIDKIRLRFLRAPDSQKRGVDQAQVDAVSRVATVATVTIALLISLDTFGVNIKTVLAFGGIGGVAIGFAGREVISNFFSGFMIYLTRPFSVGEWIRSINDDDPIDGFVEDIGWYLTRVRTWDKRPLYIPNSKFSTLIVENPSRMTNRRIKKTLHLRIEDLPVAKQIADDVRAMLLAHADLDPKQHRMAYIEGFTDFSCTLWISCYTKQIFLEAYMKTQQDVMLRVFDILRVHGARLATNLVRDLRDGTNPDLYGATAMAALRGVEAVPDVSAEVSAEARTVPSTSAEAGAEPSSRGVYANVPSRASEVKPTTAVTSITTTARSGGDSAADARSAAGGRGESRETAAASSAPRSSSSGGGGGGGGSGESGTTTVTSGGMKIHGEPRPGASASPSATGAGVRGNAPGARNGNDDEPPPQQQQQQAVDRRAAVGRAESSGEGRA
ncbi:hypothetical protein CDCA_CDCA05G1496 [Cyanidium caldarium]|uniref:Uncharacterized protein n=1 Tax=Cyanidium caldarium TaxID=2771 RepID=A0AAV9ITQ4_CYACA|nr:hypothetical protein CDCA_CDCA05G1496 [Cyanidium caldarium]